MKTSTRDLIHQVFGYVFTKRVKRNQAILPLAQPSLQVLAKAATRFDQMVRLLEQLRAALVRNGTLLTDHIAVLVQVGIAAIQRVLHAIEPFMVPAHL
ncbi:MAG: sorbitol-specific phosphotransferase system component IIBC [Lentimonas sp.]|jgi:sorbitol-specific phosphotransferase system component IIBC